jgi:hypothetical protein
MTNELDKKKVNKEFKKWLQAQIALQTDVLKEIKESEDREFKEGQIALKEQELKKKRKK